MVHVANQLPEHNPFLQGLNGRVGRHRMGFVDEFQQHPSYKLEDDQNCCHSSQPPRQGKSECLFGDGQRPEMKDQVIEQEAFPPSSGIPN